jgi:hypothetical protein
MTWQQIRQQYPKRWLLLEAIKAHSDKDKRVVEDFGILNTFEDSKRGMRSYLELHRQMPERELYVLHTELEAVRITERVYMTAFVS